MSVNISKCISDVYNLIHKCKRISHTTELGQNRVADQPSCLQCKQADKEWVSVSRLSAAALSVPCFCADHCWCRIVSSPAARGLTLWCLLWVPALGFELWSIIIQQCREAGEFGKRKWLCSRWVLLLLACQCCSVLQCLWCSSSRIVRQIVISQRLRAILPLCGARNCVWLLSDSLILLSSQLTFITVSSLTNWLHGVHYVASCGADKCDFSLLCMSIFFCGLVESNICPICYLSTVIVVMIRSHKFPDTSH